MVYEPLSRKYLTKKKIGGVVQVAEYLSSKCKALNSNLSPSNKEKKI
jgi:hypothetical protein